ncbi:MAG TPA: FlgD immunoglobulin-like domain containing protein [Solirubrobacteraceae bacterium]|nr:FlgD immunoglobulin-like domain containing protein [Solirubrobacteraceae bacterium]
MTRLSTGAFAVLVAATIAAFFITQHLKVTTPLLAGTPRPVPAVIDPLHGVPCMQGRNSGSTTISFYLLHRADTVDVFVVSDATGEIVRTVAGDRHMRKGVRNPDGVFRWDGREDNGQVAPEGTYYFRVALIHQNRTIDLSNVPVKVKTSPPRPVVTRVTPSLIPGARGTSVTIHYAGNDNRGGTIRIYRTDRPGDPLVKSFLTPWNGHTAIWDGKINGRPAPAGTYLVGLDVTDAACDTGHSLVRVPPARGTTPNAGVTVSYLAAQAPLDPVPAGSDADVQVRSPGLAYHWALSLDGTRGSTASGESSQATLSVHLPTGRPGLYKLALRSAAGTTTIPIAASGAPRARVLVVLPALTWQGLNPVDDSGNGVPNTLANGGPINLDRPLVDGPPAGIADEAGLLAYLDASHRAYELTTDLGLISGVGPRLRGRAAVVLAGSERWLPPAEMAALRAYVGAGGNLLSLGIDSLRRGVTVVGNRALDPTPPSATDALGARLGGLASKTAAPVAVTTDTLGLFTGVVAPLAGFRTYQPVLSVAAPGRVESSAAPSGASPAIVGYGLGDGVVVDLGVPGFGSALPNDAAAQQLLDQIWNVLSK